MRHTESVANLAAALVAAQAEMENANKNATNPHFKSHYADLAEIINTAKPVLTKHGLTVVQFPGFADGRAELETVLLHKSGEWMAGTAGAPLQKHDPQGVGSALTYLRRYAMAAVCAIAQEDDDGNAASSAASSKPTGAKVEPSLLKQVTNMLDLYRDRLPQSGITATESAIKAGDTHRLTKALEWMREEIAKEAAA